MNPSDLRLTQCVLCGSKVQPCRGPVYALDVDAMLCFHCAVLRGGIYDETAQNWVALPARTSVPPSAEQERKDRRFIGPTPTEMKAKHAPQTT